MAFVLAHFISTLYFVQWKAEFCSKGKVNRIVYYSKFKHVSFGARLNERSEANCVPLGFYCCWIQSVPKIGFRACAIDQVFDSDEKSPVAFFSETHRWRDIYGSMTINGMRRWCDWAWAKRAPPTSSQRALDWPRLIRSYHLNDTSWKKILKDFSLQNLVI